MNEATIQALKDAEKIKITIDEPDIETLKADEVATSAQHSRFPHRTLMPAQIIVGVAVIMALASGNLWLFLMFFPAATVFGWRRSSDIAYTRLINASAIWCLFWAAFGVILIYPLRVNVFVPLLIIAFGFYIIYAGWPTESA